jgi:dihydroxyacetone kinase
MKKLINRVEDVLNEQLQGLAKAHPQLTLHQDPVRHPRRCAGGRQGGPALRRRQRT